MASISAMMAENTICCDGLSNFDFDPNVLLIPVLRLPVNNFLQPQNVCNSFPFSSFNENNMLFAEPIQKTKSYNLSPTAKYCRPITIQDSSKIAHSDSFFNRKDEEIMKKLRIIENVKTQEKVIEPINIGTYNKKYSNIQIPKIQKPIFPKKDNNAFLSGQNVDIIPLLKETTKILTKNLNETIQREHLFSLFGDLLVSSKLHSKSGNNLSNGWKTTNCTILQKSDESLLEKGKNTFLKSSIENYNSLNAAENSDVVKLVNDLTSQNTGNLEGVFKFSEPIEHDKQDDETKEDEQWYPTADEVHFDKNESEEEKQPKPQKEKKKRGRKPNSQKLKNLETNKKTHSSSETHEQSNNHKDIITHDEPSEFYGTYPEGREEKDFPLPEGEVKLGENSEDGNTRVGANYQAVLFPLGSRQETKRVPQLRWAPTMFDEEQREQYYSELASIVGKKEITNEAIALKTLTKNEMRFEKAYEEVRNNPTYFKGHFNPGTRILRSGRFY